MESSENSAEVYEAVLFLLFELCDWEALFKTLTLKILLQFLNSRNNGIYLLYIYQL